MIKKTFVYTTLSIIIIFAVIFSNKPSHNKNWEKESAVLPHATIQNKTIMIENVRDFTYSTSSITAYNYTTRTFKTEDLEKAYFIIEPFSSFEAVGHTFLTFDIKGQEPIAFSVEARREDGENYSATKGLFNTYELWYVWGQETDLITRRGLYLDHPLHMYELDIQGKTTQDIFVSLIKETIELEKNPQFYNTLFSNCTNALAKFSNQNIKGSIPYHYSFHLTGYSDEYLYKLGLIKNDKTFKEKEMNSYITDVIKESHSDLKFSEIIRKNI